MIIILNKKAEFLKCNHGLYKIYWTSGGSSLASVGSNHQGDRWMAPTNWTAEGKTNPGALIKDHLNSIEKMESIEA